MRYQAMGKFHDVTLFPGLLIAVVVGHGQYSVLSTLEYGNGDGDGEMENSQGPPAWPTWLTCLGLRVPMVALHHNKQKCL